MAPAKDTGAFQHMAAQTSVPMSRLRVTRVCTWVYFSCGFQQRVALRE